MFEKIITFTEKREKIYKAKKQIKRDSKYQCFYFVLSMSNSLINQIYVVITRNL